MCVSGFNNIGPVPVTARHYKDVRIKQRKATSVLELLAVIVIITIWAAAMMPTLRKARLRAVAIQCMGNQKEIVISVTSFASDNNGEYPPSVATIGLMKGHWNWQEPTMLTAYRSPDTKLHRSMSAYLYGYIQDTGIMSCPSAPEKYRFLQQAWNAADDWDNPDTPQSHDPVIGTYCFYWNYVGFLEGRTVPFKGPRDIACSSGRSKLLVSDYFGFGHWRNKFIYGDYKAFGSCERFDNAFVTPGTNVSSAFWSRRADNKNINLNSFDIELHAAYADGHVDCYSPDQTIIMKVSQAPDGSVPYPDDLGPGDFYLPDKSLY